ncbi:O-antigen/teichoic acid export membrane protein [Arthrobacter pascens]|uniref:lipopolysaccharide biosynthesis protein n=1 Tax=Arthrobacter pascens TaxID=1677 RepID=UPI0028613E08|nr:polysaccharide biosynthesis C-terminal domain-containing protein [Arthrobacter pascens]MDR6555731.1 O-antigen/teichoic acid export membrane protein [Arthrobacter pascens]
MKWPNWQDLRNKNMLTIQLLLMQVLAAITAFLINIFSAAVMDPEGRGYLALLIQITYVLTVLALMGIERPFAAARSVSFFPSLYELHRLISPSYVLLVIMALASVFLYFYESGSLALSCALVLFFLAGNMASRLVRTGYIVSGSIKPFMYISVLTQMVLFAMAVVLYFLKTDKPEIWFLAYGCSGLVAAASVIFAVARRRNAGHRRSEERAIRRHGFRLLPASFGNTAMLRSDRLLLPFLASNTQLGIYVVIATTMELASWPVQNWVDASLNRWRNDHESGGSTRARAVLTAVAITSILATAMGILSYILVEYCLSDLYAESLRLIIPLGLATIVYSVTRVQQGLLIADGRTHSVSIAEVVGMLVSVGAYFVLIPPLGAMGAALGSVIGYSLCLVACALLLRRSSRDRRVMSADRIDIGR